MSIRLIDNHTKEHQIKLLDAYVLLDRGLSVRTGRSLRNSYSLGYSQPLETTANRWLNVNLPYSNLV